MRGGERRGEGRGGERGEGRGERREGRKGHGTVGMWLYMWCVSQFGWEESHSKLQYKTMAVGWHIEIFLVMGQCDWTIRTYVHGACMHGRCALLPSCWCLLPSHRTPSLSPGVPSIYLLPLHWSPLPSTQCKADITRTVQHFYYIGWPDFGVPDSPTGVLTMLHHVRAIRRSGDPDVPSIIHCRYCTYLVISYGLVTSCHFLPHLVISYHILSFLTTSCHFLPHLVISCHFLPHLVISYHILSFLATSCHFLPHLVISYHILSFLTTSCHFLSFLTTSCHFLPHLVISYHILSHLVISYHV